jgi:hypothetical protein
LIELKADLLPKPERVNGGNTIIAGTAGMHGEETPEGVQRGAGAVKLCDAILLQMQLAE